MVHPLDAVLTRTEAVVASGRLPVVVFDLDSTLFRTAGRHLAILQAFAETEPTLLPWIVGLTREAFGWHVHGPLVARGFDDADVLRRLSAFWWERFFHDDWLRHDHPAPGAVEYVRETHRAGALVYYLTARHMGGMERGTVEGLHRHGFPVLRGRTVLHLKPGTHIEDRTFKAQALRDVASHRGEVVATFENEPANANLFCETFPAARHFLVGSVCSPEAPDPRDAVIRIEDFVVRHVS